MSDLTKTTLLILLSNSLFGTPDVGKADLLLRNNGFILQSSTHECERAYHKGMSIWELHWEVNGVPGGGVGKIRKDPEGNLSTDEAV